MNRKIILNLAMSLDGFIADKSGGFEWIYGDGNRSLDTKNQWSYDNFLEQIDTVVMGKNCFDQNFHTAFSNRKVYVSTTDTIEDYDNLHFIHNDICQPILEELKQDGQNIFLFGGGITIDPFIKADIIDEYIISIVPILLGKGRPLFLENNPRIRLYLDSYYISSGITTLYYKKKI